MANIQNLASGTLENSISASTTSLAVYTGEGTALQIQGVWPTPPFYATIMPTNPAAGVPNSLDSEIVEVTAVSASDGIINLTVTRGQKGTTAKAFDEGAVITNGIYIDDIANAGGKSCPIGTIIPYSASTIPDGYLECDGSAVSRTIYADLFAVIGTTYGTGDGSTTFNLPNLKGKVAVGQNTGDASFDVLGETGGEKTHKLTVSEMPKHTHRISSQRGTPGNSSWDYGQPGTGWNATAWNPNPTEPIGGNGAHNNLQPYIVVKYIIKFANDAMSASSVVNSYSTSTTDVYSASYVNSVAGGGTFTTLWTNSNPGVAFGAKTVSIANLSTYLFIDILVVPYDGGNLNTIHTVRHYYDATRNRGEISQPFRYNGTRFYGSRIFTVNSGSVVFETAYNDAGVAAADWYIPWKIIGYKAN